MEFNGDFFASKLVKSLYEIHRESGQWFDIVRNMVFKLYREVKARGFDFIVIKGIGLNDCIYGSDNVRIFGDLDLLIDSADLIAWNQLLNSMGFFQQIGPTSTGSSYNRYARAFTAVHAKNAEVLYDPLDFPVKAHQSKPEYKPYCRQGCPNIELHDGLYYLTGSAVRTMMKGTVCVEKETGSYHTLDPAHTFILLLTNTFENSESFFSNTSDFDMILRDYVDLRFFKEI